MSIHVAIHHRTIYRFDRMVRLGPHVLRLRPAPHCRTPIGCYSLRVEPAKHFVHWQQDPFGNFLARLVFPEPAAELAIDVDLVADLTVINPFDFFLEETAEHVPFAYEPRVARELAPYLEAAEHGPRLARWLGGVSRESCGTIPFLVDLNRRLAADIAYTIRLEPGVQSCEETLERAAGSCRDSGWLLVQILRHLGLAARFVSGYLVQCAPDEPPLDGPPGPAADFTDLHAWAEVYVPGAGWIGLDPTSGLFAGEGHIPLAATPEPESAAPVTGLVEPCAVDFRWANEVRRIAGSTSSARPFEDAQWGAICALGEAVDADLERGDVRLTMGGEPTFVSIDDRESPEWTVDALGSVKRQLAEDLVRRLHARFAPGGILHFGQGKWYPGEILPRWALTCAWRADGVPVWRDASLVADASRPRGDGLAEASRFIGLLARRLGLCDDHVVAGHEDALYYLWKEQRLPDDVDPHASALDDPEERRRLARVLERGLGTVTGYALPLGWRCDAAGGGWATGRWRFRRERMVLVPGSSAMGYRLPLDSLPWLAPELREHDFARCTFDELDRLAPDYARIAYDREVAMQAGLQEAAPRFQAYAGSHRAAAADGGDGNGAAPLPEQGTARRAEPRADGAPHIPAAASHLDLAAEGGDVVRTAVCVEPRDGTLYVFVPPLTHLEHYLDLVAAIETVAAELGTPVVVEGHDPPRDPRLLRLQVTPDPGVIEVNVHPVASWGELVAVQSVLYEEAKQCRLGTEKFMLDGRATGTGGGNHVTLGGPSPSDSPLLRRPDLLRSLVTYWQHHPSLSYLLSGLFVGPTSQAPRVDEARDDALYELEIALRAAPVGEVVAPWLVDRLFRNLLVDVTGNPHRAEFCIDKLYSPDGPAGRLGLLEMRAFEMPPSPRLALLQLLLLRALVARFWRVPYAGPLVRWGTELHDRFMLPHFLWQDFCDVLGELREHGHAFDPQWFVAFLDWRFPRLGAIQVRDLELELRAAIEPWHVLGEEIGSRGTTRYVDSSLERLQVRVTGMTDGRHVVACNGRRVPLRATGTRSELVAGVRYRAWRPPSALHPTIPVHAPLVLDVVDTWAGRSVGGCTYHVAHPGGRSYETFPVNAAEAEARRVARFWPHGHTPGPMQPPHEERDPELPYTLDLRRRRDA